MLDNLVYFLDGGLLKLSWWALFIIAIVFTHATIAGVTIFLHRCQAHRGLDLHPVISHFFRFWLWLTTGMVTKEWVAVHRKHHSKCETEEDPHSPQTRGLKKVLLEGAELYKEGIADPKTIERYGQGTPDDWLERNIYSTHQTAGIVLMLFVDVALFGAAGLLLWAVQMIWIPFWAAGVINGLAHWWGYRNFETLDTSTNISPFGIIIGGEELHNNHHAYPSSAKFQLRKGEFDIGWLYIRLMEKTGLCKIKKEALMPQLDETKAKQDVDGLRAVIMHRVHIMADYGKNVMQPTLLKEWTQISEKDYSLAKSLKKLVQRYSTDTESVIREDSGTTWSRLNEVVSHNSTLASVYEYRQQLVKLWSNKLAGHEQLLSDLNDWCHRAEQSGIEALQKFAVRLRQTSLAVSPR